MRNIKLIIIAGILALACLHSPLTQALDLTGLQPLTTTPNFDMTCPTGQVMSGVSSGQPVCVIAPVGPQGPAGVAGPAGPEGPAATAHSIYGGMFQTRSNGTCPAGNSYTLNTCSCPWWASRAKQVGYFAYPYPSQDAGYVYICEQG